MVLIANEGKRVDFTKDNPSPGQHVAVCIGVWDIGWHESEWKGQKRLNHKILIRWEIDELIDGGEYHGKHKTINQRYNLSLGEKSILRKDLLGWRGKDLTTQELKDGFDLEAMIGQSCMINVAHVTKNDKTYANIQSISPLFKGVKSFTPDNKWDGSAPDWVKKIQENSTKPAVDFPEEATPAEVAADAPEDTENMDAPWEE